MDTKFYGCKCGMEVLGLNDDPEWEVSYVGMFVLAGANPTLWDRIKGAVEVLRKGYWAANEATLDLDDLSRLRDDLTEIIEAKEAQSV